MLIAFTTGSAFCEGNTSLNGVVAATDVERIIAPYAGEVITLLFREGDAVTAGMEAATMSPNYVLAPCSGTVTLFASQGDDALDVQLIYGALACVEPDASYTVAAEILLDSCLPQNQLVHPGESVYLCCMNDGSHSGKGIITSVTGSSFTVLVTEGDFLFGEAVDICRRGDCMEDDCIGNGTLSRINPLTCTGEGLVISEFVGNGDHVEAGEVLYELAPTWDAHFVMHEASGIVAEVCVRETPILKPVMESVGVDPVVFGMIMMTCVTFGVMTPPVGTGLYTTADIMGCSIQDVVKDGWPFYVAVLLVVVVMVFFPDAVLFLPNLVYGVGGA